MSFLKHILGIKNTAVETERTAAEPGVFYSPMKGTVIPLSEVEDPVFAQETTMLLVTNSDSFKEMTPPVLGEVEKGEKLFSVNV